MSKYCSDCDYLNEKKKKADGLYECKKTKKMVLACNPACDKFENCYSRSWYDKQVLYDKGEKLAKDPGDEPLKPYIIGLILLIVFCILGYLLGFA